MAKTSTIQYVTHRTLKDIYPSMDEYDTRKPVYGWTQVGGSGNVWRTHNTGLVTRLFKDGADLGQDISAGSGGAQWSANIDTTLDSAADSDAAITRLPGVLDKSLTCSCLFLNIFPMFFK